MGDLDFCADLMITGTVLGVDHTSDLATVEETLGRHRTMRTGPHEMVTDTGLIEFRWRQDPRGDWAVSSFGAWLHRQAEIEPALLARYGDLRCDLRFDDLLTAVRARGFELVDRREPTSGMVAEVDDGAVVGIVRPEASWGIGPPVRLAELSAEDLARWLDRHAPDDPEWWNRLRAAVVLRAGNSPTRWRPLWHALDREAAERGIDPPDEAAVRLAVAVAEARTAGVAEELPTMDQAIRDWLAVAPSPDRAAALGVGPLDADDVRLARRLRTQIHALESCLAYVSAELGLELLTWIRLKSSLLTAPRHR